MSHLLQVGNAGHLTMASGATVFRGAGHLEVKTDCDPHERSVGPVGGDLALCAKLHPPPSRRADHKASIQLAISSATCSTSLGWPAR